MLRENTHLEASGYIASIPATCARFHLREYGCHMQKMQLCFPHKKLKIVLSKWIKIPRVAPYLYYKWTEIKPPF